MTRDELLDLMSSDLKNEYTHMLFYLSASSTIRGLHRVELREWLEEEAASEMEHVKEFSKLLVSLGRVPATDFHPFSHLSDPVEIVQKAIDLEQEVCNNYAKRLNQVEKFLKSIDESDRPLSTADPRAYSAWTRVGLFYEDQLSHSHHDLDDLRQILGDVQN